MSTLRKFSECNPSKTALVRQFPINEKVVIKTADALHLIKVQQIVRCEADANYTKIFFEEGKCLISARTLKEYESLLNHPSFMRVHQSHLINTDHLVRLEKKEGGWLIMENEDRVPVSKRNKEKVLNHFAAFDSIRISSNPYDPDNK